MKPINKILVSLLTITALISCSDDFLDRPSLSQISTENFYQTRDELRLATAALYGGKLWGDWTYNCYIPVGDVLSGNMAVGYWGDAVQLHTFAVTGQNAIMSANWKSMYKIIAHCNTTINAINEKAPASIPEKDKNAAIAEAKFIRAYAYYNLAILWGDVPIIEDNTRLITAPLVNKNNVNDVYQFAVNDLVFAANFLPNTDAKGRVTTWSAQGLLAKVFLTWAGLNSPGQRNQALLDNAKLFAGNVCKNSGLDLLPNYADLFKTQYNDNQESLFALQWVPSSSGWLEGNMLQIYNTISEIAPNGEAGWFGIGPTYDLYQQYTEQDSIRRKATFMLQDDYYPELNSAGGGYKFIGNSTPLKKHIVGTTADNNSPTMTRTSSPEHNSLLRLADVYLIYVEAILGNNSETSDADAVMFFNKVRTRAGLDPVTTVTSDLLRKERRIELAAEGHFWTDIVRLSYYDVTKATSILNNQQRVTFTFEDGVAEEGNAYGEVTPANEQTFRFPLPSSEVTANPKLLDPAIPYSF
jgi:starch-binding outer membrane protein, SusD/RagB family